jgi:hypothetical protein
MDPCVRRGNCKAIWPPEGFVDKIPAGAVVTKDGRLWEIACENDCGETVYGTYYNSEGDLLLKCDDSILIPKEELGKWYFDTTDYITDDNKLEVWLYDEDGNQVERIFYSDTGKKVPRLLGQFFRSSVNGPARFRTALDEETIVGKLLSGGTYAVVDVIYAQIYSNPLISQEFREARGGSLLVVDPETKLVVNGVIFVSVQRSDFGEGGWIDERAIKVEEREDIYPASNEHVSERNGES